MANDARSMNLLTLPMLLQALAVARQAEDRFDELRQFVFEYYEAERDLELDVNLETIFPVLSSYLEEEEAYGDPDRKERLLRLCTALEGQSTFLRERVVFALNFDRIQDLRARWIAERFDQQVYEEQLRKLAPVDFDQHKVEDWARAHVDMANLDPHSMR